MFSGSIDGILNGHENALDGVISDVSINYEPLMNLLDYLRPYQL